MAIQIHGKTYVTVAERVHEAHELGQFKSLQTEVLQHTPVVVVKATVTIGEKTFTGISGANPNKSIEKASPYEVAETSAVGRALGFAGYGIIESIATADEMTKATVEVTEDAVLIENCVDCVKAGSKSPSIPAFVYEESMRDYGLSICFTHRKDHKKI